MICVSVSFKCIREVEIIKEKSKHQHGSGDGDIDRHINCFVFSKNYLKKT